MYVQINCYLGFFKSSFFFTSYWITNSVLGSNTVFHSCEMIYVCASSDMVNKLILWEEYSKMVIVSSGHYLMGSFVWVLCVVSNTYILILCST